MYSIKTPIKIEDGDLIDFNGYIFRVDALSITHDAVPVLLLTSAMTE